MTNDNAPIATWGLTDFQWLQKLAEHIDRSPSHEGIQLTVEVHYKGDGTVARIVTGDGLSETDVELIAEAVNQ